MSKWNRWISTLGALVLFSHAAIGASAYPDGPMKIVIPFAPGGTTDIVGRYVARSLGEILGTPVFVENLAGGRGTVGTRSVANSTKDGLTLLLGSASSLVLNPTLSKTVPFDPIKDFSPVGVIAKAFAVLVVSPSLQVKSVDELVALAKSEPGTINYASSGTGSTPHIFMEMFKKKTSTDLVHIPYQGTGPALVDLMSGQGGTVMMPNIPAVKEQILAGKIRALAVNAKERSPLLPNVPTMAESGFGGMEYSEWFGILAPAGTPDFIIQQLNAAIDKMGSDPATVKVFSDLGLVPQPGTPESFAQLIKSDLNAYREIITSLQINQD